ncbi:MAG: family 78 glycoside hydrolase catalytic domain [Fimbriimonas sp.]
MLAALPILLVVNHPFPQGPPPTRTTSISVGASVQMNPDSLRCDQLVNPGALNGPHPVLSWQSISNSRGARQKAFRIVVASSVQALGRDKGDLWDSGKVNSSKSTTIRYAGLPLTSRTKAFWKVMVWDERDKPSPWSRPASWTMGLLQAGDWEAKWIGATEDSAPQSTATYPSPYFLKSFQSNKTIKNATAYVSGLGFYELSINGRKIGDQVLAPAVTNYDRRPLEKLLYPHDDQSRQRVLYNCFDVSREVLQGANCIGIVLGNGWYNQRDRTVEGMMWYDVPRLIFQLEITYTDGSIQKVVSDDSWKTSTGPLLHDGIFSGERYDARLDLGDWQKADYNDNGWRNALLVRDPTGKLEAQTAPFDKVVRTLRPGLQEKKGLVSRFRLTETVSGWASIGVRGKAGSEVKIRYIAEEGDDYGQTDTYILKGDGIEAWKPRFTWHTFRDLEVTASDDSIELESLVVEDVHTAVDGVGTFECSNPLFNRIHEAFLQTQRANFHGSISSDCPHRERLGYTGDGQVIMESALYTFDLFQFYRKWINDIDDARNHKTGFVPHTAPFGGGGGGPAWGSAYVIMPWTYYCRYGDASLLRQHYNGMKQWVSYLQTRTDDKGLVVREEPNGWCLGDWGTPTGVEIPEPFVNTAYFYHVTDLMSKVAQVLGEKDDYEKYQTLARKIKADFNTVYYDASKKRYWEGRQGANAFALGLGLVPDDKYAQVLGSLIEELGRLNYHFDTGILGTPLLVKVLSQNDRDDLVFKLMNQKDFPSFGYLLDEQNSTLWEFWDGNGSRCHPMFGSVASWFYDGLAGIKIDPASVGMQHFLIEPKTVVEMDYCKASYRSLYGKIRSEWKSLGNGKHRFIAEVPPNTSATFILPAHKGRVTSADGKDIPVKKIRGKWTVELKAGIHEFDA